MKNEIYYEWAIEISTLNPVDTTEIYENFFDDRLTDLKDDCTIAVHEGVVMFPVICLWRRESNDDEGIVDSTWWYPHDLTHHFDDGTDVPLVLLIEYRNFINELDRSK